MNLYHELGSVKVHGNTDLHTLTRAHLTIVGSPSWDKALGFRTPCLLPVTVLTIIYLESVCAFPLGIQIEGLPLCAEQGEKDKNSGVRRSEET